MIGNIVIFTDYYVHSLIDIVEESSLTVGLFCVSDYSECMDLVQTVPNLLGVLVVDWKPTVRTFKFYIYALKIANLTDEILKLDGIGPILSESQGLFNVSESYAINPSKAEFDSDYFNTVVFALLDPNYEISYDMLEKHPLLRSIQNHRNGDLPDDALKKLLEHPPFSHMV